jgi:hypothetical protein
MPRELPYISARSSRDSRTVIAALSGIIAATAIVVILVLAAASLTGGSHAALKRSSPRSTQTAAPIRTVRAHNAVLNPITGEMHGG